VDAGWRSIRSQILFLFLCVLLYFLLHASEAVVACNSQSHGRSEIVLNVNMAI